MSKSFKITAEITKVRKGKMLPIDDQDPSDAELAELRLDRERLDFLINTKELLLNCPRDGWYFTNGYDKPAYKTPREAIDAAMKEMK